MWVLSGTLSRVDCMLCRFEGAMSGVGVVR